MFLGFILHWRVRTMQLTTQSLSFIGSEALWQCDSSWNFILWINVCKKFIKDSLRPRPRVSTYFWKQIFSVLAFRPQYFHRFNVFTCCCCCGCCLIFMLWVLFKILKRPWLSSCYGYRHYSWAIDDCQSTYFRSQILWPCYSVWRYHWPLCYVQSCCCWSLCVSRINEIRGELG